MAKSKIILPKPHEVVTDDVVRDYFKEYEEDVIIERQSSENPKIDKLLKTASKKGNGEGHPDLILQYKHDKKVLLQNIMKVRLGKITISMPSMVLFFMLVIYLKNTMS